MYPGGHDSVPPTHNSAGNSAEKDQGDGSTSWEAAAYGGGGRSRAVSVRPTCPRGSRATEIHDKDWTDDDTQNGGEWETKGCEGGVGSCAADAGSVGRRGMNNLDPPIPYPTLPHPTSAATRQPSHLRPATSVATKEEIEPIPRVDPERECVPLVHAVTAKGERP